VRVDSTDPDVIDATLASLLDDRRRFVEPVRTETVWLRAAREAAPMNR